MKYYVLLAIFFSLITGPIVAHRETPKLKIQINRIINVFTTMYPQDLVVTIENGVLTTNKEEDVVIPLLPGGMEDPEIKYKNLIVIKPNGTVDDFAAYETLVLANSKNILVQDDLGKMQVYPISELPNTTIDKEDIKNFENETKSLLEYLPQVLSVTLVGTYLSYYLIVRLIYLVGIALLCFVSYKLSGLELTLNKYFQIALHSSTLPLLIELIANIVGITIQVSFWFFMVHMFVNTIFLLSLKESVQTLEE